MNPFAQHVDIKSPHKLVTAEEIVEGIHLSAERLIELAKCGTAPCWYVDEKGPFFKKREIKEWIAKHLYTRSPGTECLAIAPILIPENPNRGTCVPIELSLLADRLIDFPVFGGIPGVYFLVKETQIVYIGMSESNTGSRVMQHCLTKEFDSAFVLPLPARDARLVELALIRCIKPPYNGHNTKGEPDPWMEELCDKLLQGKDIDPGDQPHILHALRREREKIIAERRAAGNYQYKRPWGY